MTIHQGRLYKCDICGKIAPWSDSWWNYGSVAMEETCPGDMPSACSDECKKILEQKIKTHEFILPILKMAGPHFNIKYERRGY